MKASAKNDYQVDTDVSMKYNMDKIGTEKIAPR